MKKTKSNYNLLNNIIRTHIQVVEDVASYSAHKDFKIVKELYLKRLQEIKEEEATQAAITKREETIGKARKLHTIFNAEEAIEKKQTLTRTLTELDKELETYKAEGIIVDLDEEEVEFKRLLLEFPQKYVNKKRIHQQYKSWASNLLEFSRETKVPLQFSQLDFGFYNKYGEYLMFKRMKGKKKMVNNTFGGQVKKLKQFVTWCRKYKKVKNVNLIYEDYPVLRKPKDIVIYLEEDELDLLYNEYRETVSDAKKRLIDVTVLQCCLGLRYGDLYASGWRVETVDGGKILTGETEKNDGIYVLPFSLDRRIEEILERYDYKMNHVSEQVYNREIKLLLKKFFEHYGIHQEPITYLEKRFDDKIEVTNYKYNLIASHSNRRRFINYWKLQGFEDQSILDMLGSKDSVVLQGYKKKDIASTSKVVSTKLSQIKIMLDISNELATV